MARVNNNSDGDASATKSPPTNSKVKLMCSYGGKIQPRPQDQQLTYVGGDSKILAVDRNIKFSDIVAKLNFLYKLNAEEFCIKYQLPGEDLDVLISLINDDDLENMMFEYERWQKKVSPDKPGRFRLFISTVKNSNPRMPNSDSGSEAPLNPDYLFGFDKEYDYTNTNSSQPSTSTTPAFDLSLWTIPKTVSPGNSGSINGIIDQGEILASRDGHLTSVAASGQVVYRVPVVGGGFQMGQYGVHGFVAVGGVTGHREHPVYHLVPSIPSLPEPVKMVGSPIDMACHDGKVHNHNHSQLRNV